MYTVETALDVTDVVRFSLRSSFKSARKAPVVTVIAGQTRLRPRGGRGWGDEGGGGGLVGLENARAERLARLSRRRPLSGPHLAMDKHGQRRTPGRKLVANKDGRAGDRRALRLLVESSYRGESFTSFRCRSLASPDRSASLSVSGALGRALRLHIRGREWPRYTAR